ncbi:MAG: phosphoserine phosphatase SerB [Chloroflexi bacterium]|nr:MAG: phosphoserine phosphatase SerB [Chloroflexota bacterium]
MSEIILVNITGPDQRGLVARMVSVLAEHEVNILDIGQSVIHDYISLGLLIEIPPAQQSAALLKELLFAAHEAGVAINFRPTALDAYERWVAEQGKERRIITMLGRRLTADQIARVAAAAAENGLNIDVITRLSGRISLQNAAHQRHACVQLTVSGPLDDEYGMRSRLFQISEETGIDISFQVDDIYRRNRRLVCFDMDSTLIQGEVIDELAALKGVGKEVAAITAAAMRGELDYRTSLVQRVALLEGLPEQALEEVARNITLTEGAEHAIGVLRRLGYKTAILSGGFTYFGRYLQERLGIDYMYANRLEIVNGRLTGRLVGEIVDGPRKAELLREIADAEGLRLEQTIAVGDGANDLPMLGVAGLGVAFHAKPIVRRRAGQALSAVGLDGLLYLMGIRAREGLT